MKYSNMRFIRLSAAALAATVVLILPSTANGQSGNRNQAPPAPGSPKPGDELRPSSIRERQFRMMEMERELGSPPPRTPEEEQLAVVQIAEDYKQLQMVNNKMMSGAMPAASPNYANIAQTMSEIRRRATRLKDNLRLGKLEVKEPVKGKHKQALNAADMKSNLLSLDSFIMRFVKNAIFENPDVVNVEEATKARGDLDVIIENSQLINKDAERLKSSQKTP